MGNRGRTEIAKGVRFIFQLKQINLTPFLGTFFVRKNHLLQNARRAGKLGKFSSIWKFC